MGHMRNVYKLLVRKPERRDFLGDIGLDGIIIFH
jgi:hypothetical protein